MNYEHMVVTTRLLGREYLFFDADGHVLPHLDNTDKNGWHQHFTDGGKWPLYIAYGFGVVEKGDEFGSGVITVYNSEELDG